MPKKCHANNATQTMPQPLLHFIVMTSSLDLLDFESLKLAADRGHPTAMVGVALSYYHGLGVRRNFEEAARYFKKAAELGFAGGVGESREC